MVLDSATRSGYSQDTISKLNEAYISGTIMQVLCLQHEHYSVIWNKESSQTMQLHHIHPSSVWNDFDKSEKELMLEDRNAFEKAKKIQQTTTNLHLHYCKVLLYSEWDRSDPHH